MDNRIFYNLISRSKTAQSLTTDVQSYLFCSKDTDALMLLAEYLVSKENDGKFSSADVKILPEGEKVLVADIESITSTAAITPLELKSKYYILKNAETMNDSAANKLLKTLEEPPPKVKLIIIADNEYSVLPTVRSRCRIVNFPQIDSRELYQAADEAYEGLTDRAKQLSFGSLTRLNKVVAGGYQESEELVFDILLNMKNSTMVAKYSQAIIKKKADLAEVLQMFELVFSDALRCGVGASPVLLFRQSEIKEIANFYFPDTLIRLKPVLEKAARRLKYSGNAASITDEFLFSLLEVRQKCQS